jgi:hypothetical protein
MAAPRSYCPCKRFPFNQNDLHADLCSECCLRWGIHRRSKPLLDVETLWRGEWESCKWQAEGPRRRRTKGCDTGRGGRDISATSNHFWDGLGRSRYNKRFPLDILRCLVTTQQCREWEMSCLITILKCEQIRSLRLFCRRNDCQITVCLTQRRDWTLITVDFVVNIVTYMRFP